MSQSPYEILGVSRDADAAAIKAAYRRLAKRLHPDSTGGDRQKENRFKEVVAAYAILVDDDKRRAYDAGIGGDGPSSDGPSISDLVEDIFGPAHVSTRGSFRFVDDFVEMAEAFERDQKKRRGPTDRRQGLRDDDLVGLFELVKRAFKKR